MEKVQVQKFQSDRPTWCPGCGDFGVLRALQQAVAELGLEPHEVVLVSGIGCSGKITSYFHSYGFHTMHGRTLPVATGIKLANPALTVIAAGGDGDGYGIGLNHVLHAIRRNVNLTYIVMDNGVYGNTKGQTAPNSPRGYVSPSSPYGSTEDPIAILPIALGAGISFLAQGIASDVPGLTAMIRRAIEHPGFALVNAISPCVTYDKVHTYPWYKERIYSLEKAGHPTHDRNAAFAAVCATDGRIPIGVIYEDVHSEDFENRLSRFTQPAAGIEFDDTLRARYESLMQEWA